MPRQPSAGERGPDRQGTLRAFGLKVRDVRIARGLSQEQLAAACGLDRTYIGGVERGERNLGLLNIVRIARTLSLKPAELLETLE
ncbi:helix-turn-helix transcriptional regulator [Roseisolibacter sp. H3M3-2]|nr:helix-turn-helix transcriptional regulator [Roseisolibacter sp. H3M3-2]MDF1502689.1 helix-turn-helix transcriptional regulator [Roseisolibacter sp. H3M3-2]